jgi:hypothetical protein
MYLRAENSLKVRHANIHNRPKKEVSPLKHFLTTFNNPHPAKSFEQYRERWLNPL